MTNGVILHATHQDFDPVEISKLKEIIKQSRTLDRGILHDNKIGFKQQDRKFSKIYHTKPLNNRKPCL